MAATAMIVAPTKPGGPTAGKETVSPQQAPEEERNGAGGNGGLKKGLTKRYSQYHGATPVSSSTMVPEMNIVSQTHF